MEAWITYRVFNANMPDKRASALIDMESPRQGTSYLERPLDTGISSNIAGGQAAGCRGRARKPSNCRAQRRHYPFSRRGVPG